MFKESEGIKKLKYKLHTINGCITVTILTLNYKSSHNVLDLKKSKETLLRLSKNQSM